MLTKIWSLDQLFSTEGKFASRGYFRQGSPTPRASVRTWASEQKLSSGPLNEASPAVPLHSPSLALLLNQPLCSHTQSMEKIVFHETGPWSKNIGDHWFGIIQRQFWLLIMTREYHWQVWAGIRDTTKNPARYRTAPHNKELSGPKCLKYQGWEALL